MVSSPRPIVFCARSCGSHRASASSTERGRSHLCRLDRCAHRGGAGDVQTPRGPLRARSQRRFRERGADPLRKSGIKWMRIRGRASDTMRPHPRSTTCSSTGYRASGRKVQARLAVGRSVIFLQTARLCMDHPYTCMVWIYMQQNIGSGHGHPRRLCARSHHPE
jgi:hypothetical protein